MNFETDGGIVEADTLYPENHEVIAVTAGDDGVIYTYVMDKKTGKIKRMRLEDIILDP